MHKLKFLIFILTHKSIHNCEFLAQARRLDLSLEVTCFCIHKMNQVNSHNGNIKVRQSSLAVCPDRSIAAFTNCLHFHVLELSPDTESPIFTDCAGLIQLSTLTLSLVCLVDASSAVAHKSAYNKSNNHFTAITQVNLH